MRLSLTLPNLVLDREGEQKFCPNPPKLGEKLDELLRVSSIGKSRIPVSTTELPEPQESRNLPRREFRVHAAIQRSKTLNALGVDDKVSQRDVDPGQNDSSSHNVNSSKPTNLSNLSDTMRNRGVESLSPELNRLETVEDMSKLHIHVPRTSQRSPNVPRKRMSKPATTDSPEKAGNLSKIMALAELRQAKLQAKLKPKERSSKIGTKTNPEFRPRSAPLRRNVSEQALETDIFGLIQPSRELR